MRLINTETFVLEDFIGNNIPPYAILSHTWEEEEVTLQEFNSKSQEVMRKRGYEKIWKSCEFARKYDNMKYAWVDTCCIDKTSSAELTEAIKPMFEWYVVKLPS
jgi:hypothetical protein